MTRRIFLFAGLLVGLLVFNFGVARASECVPAVVGDVEFGEVSYISTTSDWVVLKNIGDHCVDISGLDFFDTANSKINANFSSTAIDPLGEVTIGLGDRLNSESSGDCLLLSPFATGKKCSVDETYTPGDIFDCFSYGPKSSWCDQIMSVFSSTTSTDTTSTTDDAPEEGDEDLNFSAQENNSTDYFFWQNIRLNEIVSDPSDGDEWVELYNLVTTSFDLAGGYICDNRASTSTCKDASGVIVGNGFLAISLGSGYLNNSGDSVVLRAPNYEIIDNVNYSGDGAPKKGESLARSISGGGIWQITAHITSGTVNIITARPTPLPPVNIGSSHTPSVTPLVVAPQATTTVLINEIYPDPVGTDSDDEFIELYNFGSVAVDLGGWKIKDNEKSFNISTNIPAGGYLVLRRPDTGIALNNTTAESVVLVDAWDREADKISYDRAQTGESYNRTAESWQWSSILTPGEENIIEELDAVGVIWKILAPETGEPDENLKFSALGSVDPRGGQLSFVWKFATSSHFVGPEIERSFTTSGIYEYEIIATSTAGSVANKKLNVKIGAGLSVQNVAVGITEIFPNPDGSDDNEYIEISNFGSSTVNLANWILRVDTKKYEIPAGTNITPNSSLVFYRLATKMALNNSGGKVSLLTPAEDLADFIKYDKAVSGKSYSLLDNVWSWGNPDPGVFLSESSEGGSNGEIVSKVAPSVLGAKIINTASVSKKYGATAILDARSASKDTALKVSGIVTVLPGVFGTQYFYIEDGANGLQVYQNKKDFPILNLGDQVEVNGLTSEASGQKRIRASGAGDIKIIKNSDAPVPLEITIDELSEELLGRLVKVAGDITEMKSGYFYLDNEVGEIRVSLKKGALIDKKLFNEGDAVEVNGILENGSSGMEIWPRFQDDIVVIGVAPEVAGIKISSGRDPRDYVIAVLGMVCAVMGGYLARERLAK